VERVEGLRVKGLGLGLGLSVRDFRVQALAMRVYNVDLEFGA
jgi:hypothetical protein